MLLLFIYPFNNKFNTQEGIPRVKWFHIWVGDETRLYINKKIKKQIKNDKDLIRTEKRYDQRSDSNQPV